MEQTEHLDLVAFLVFQDILEVEFLVTQAQLEHLVFQELADIAA